MSRGLIVRWDFKDDNNNDGSIAGCSPDVVGQFLAFTLDGVADQGLVALLKANTHILNPPNCAQPPGPNWVNFDASDGFAINIDRIFK